MKVTWTASPISLSGIRHSDAGKAYSKTHDRRDGKDLLPHMGPSVRVMLNRLPTL